MKLSSPVPGASRLSDIKVQRLQLGPYGTNAYVVACADKGTSLLIDAPGEASDILEALAGRKPTCILITHGHPDHLECLTELKSILKVPVAAHKADAGMLPLAPDWLLEDQDVVAIGWTALRVFHTPGHTPGSLCFWGKGNLFSGDTLFPNGPGRTNTPQDLQQVVESIRTRLIDLPEETIVHPGHGEPTVLGKEKKLFLNFSRRRHSLDLNGDVLWSPPA